MSAKPKQSRRAFLQTAAKSSAVLTLPALSSRAADADAALTVTDPIDGAVMHPRLGRVTAAGLEIDIRGTAPAGLDVLVNSMPARREQDRFVGKAILKDGENRVSVSATGGGTTRETVIRIPLIRDSVKRYRVVIDDNSFWLRDITQKNYASIFDCFYLKMLQDLHKRHGAKFTLNLYFTTGDDWNLRQFPDKYRGEWRDNDSWLRLAFHAYADKPDRPYQEAPVEKLLADLDLVHQQILRFAGAEAYSPPAVIHWGMTRPEAWHPLYDRGSRVLGGYFVKWARWDINYNMDDFRSEWLSKNDLLKDYASGIVFSKVDMVINSTPLDQIVPKLEKITADPRQGEVVDLLTHEQYFWPFYKNYLPDHPQRMDRAIGYLTELGYRPVFLQDEFKD
ncbi:MAG: hypothetical protein PHG96_00110 [Kiritimatiellae bacterium]|nr:hypothetical protein [Kiritimatiellia bacterium]MDD4024362.1 hypothetical protein [Kiritimatiellia bacterium]MDD4621745.1 hypothetical protein [Kiritimatiellia bacterium]